MEKLGLTATAIVCMEIEKKNQIPSLQWPRVLHKCFWPPGFIFYFDPFYRFMSKIIEYPIFFLLTIYGPDMT